MKRNLKLMAVSEKERLNRKELKTIRIGAAGGGGPSMCANWSGCSCGCKYVNSGGSGTEDNFDANAHNVRGMLMSPGVDYDNADNRLVIQ